MQAVLHSYALRYVRTTYVLFSRLVPRICLRTNQHIMIRRSGSAVKQVGLTRLELVTLPLSEARSNHLSYRPASGPGNLNN